METEQLPVENNQPVPFYITLIFYIIGYGSNILRIIKYYRGWKYYKELKYSDNIIQFIGKDYIQKLIDKKLLEYKVEMYIQIYYTVVFSNLFTTNIVPKILNISTLKYDFLTNFVFIAFMTLIMFLSEIIPLVARIVVKIKNDEKEPVVTQIAYKFAEFSILLVFNIVVSLILTFYSFSLIYVVVSVLLVLYTFYTNVIMVHVVLPNNSEETLPDGELKEAIKSVCLKKGVIVGDIKYGDYMAVNFCGVTDKKDLIIGKELVENKSTEEICSYIQYKLYDNFDHSIKCTLLECLSTVIYCYIIVYIFNHSNQFFQTNKEIASIGLFSCEYLYSNISRLFKYFVNKKEYQWNLKGLDNVEDKKQFNSYIEHVLQTVFFYSEELSKLKKVQKQEEEIQLSKEMKYRNPNYREGDDDDEGHDDDCECEICEYRRRVVKQRAMLPNKKEATLEDIYLDEWSTFETTQNPTFFNLFNITTEMIKKDN